MRINTHLSLSIFIALFLSFESSYLFAQQLEEIIVTAQRREQTLQEVPISINVVSGSELRRQGFSNLEDFATYSPSVTMEDEQDSTVTTIRGFGTQGNSMTLQSAAPVFLDNVHFGRVVMVRTAFMDTERLEVLKGPQPLYFGMNATAGAFNIQSKRPSQEWDASSQFELGNFGTYEFEGGIGGPISDTLAFRVAGLYEHSEGPIKNGVSDKRSPLYENLGGRLSLQWNPTEDLSVFTKLEGSKYRKTGDIRMGCLTAGRLAGFRDNSPINGAASSPDIGDDQAIFAPPPKGIGFNTDAVLPERKEGDKCFRGDYGQTRSKPYLEPGANPNLFEERASGRAGPGYIDIREAAEAFYSMEGPNGPGLSGGMDIGGSDWRDDTNSLNALVAIDYALPNGMSINSETGYVEYQRDAMEDNTDSFFLGNPLARTEDYDQWSQQLRLTSPAEGYDLIDAINVGFMVGVFHQEAGLDAISNGGRANLRRGQRLNYYTEDVKWTNLFWNLDFGVMDNQVTLSVGGRFSDDKHRVQVTGEAAQWIFNEAPCDYDIGVNPTQDDNPETCPTDPIYFKVDPNLTTETFAPGTTARTLVRLDSPLILVDNVDLDNLWTVGRWQTERGVPLNWRKPEVNAVGLTAPVESVRYEREGGPYDEKHGADNYDTQVVLSYTPNALEGNHTFYGKYVTAFKGPVSDTGFATIPATADDLLFEPEFVDSFEVGAKGTLLARRIRYDISAFFTKFTDLQTIADAPIFNPTEQSTISLNAGRQDVKGFEFSMQAAVTDRLSFNLAGAIMDGTMKDFDGGGCTDSELVAAAVNAVRNPSGRSQDALDFAEEILSDIDEVGLREQAESRDIPDILLINGGCRLEDTILPNGGLAEQETINRSGDRSFRTPDFKIVMGADYIHPFGNEYQFMLNAHGYISGSVLTGENLEREIMHPAQGDMNISGGVGSQDGTWELAMYARSIFQATAIYRPEFNFLPDGYASYSANRNFFRSYGIRFNYNFF